MRLGELIKGSTMAGRPASATHLSARRQTSLQRACWPPLPGGQTGGGSGSAARTAMLSPVREWGRVSCGGRCCWLDWEGLNVGGMPNLCQKCDTIQPPALSKANPELGRTCSCTAASDMRSASCARHLAQQGQCAHWYQGPDAAAAAAAAAGAGAAAAAAAAMAVTVPRECSASAGVDWQWAPASQRRCNPAHPAPHLKAVAVFISLHSGSPPNCSTTWAGVQGVTAQH